MEVSVLLRHATAPSYTYTTPENRVRLHLEGRINAHLTDIKRRFLIYRKELLDSRPKPTLNDEFII